VVYQWNKKEVDDLILEDSIYKLLVVSEHAEFSEFIKKILTSDNSKTYSVTSSMGALSVLSEEKINLIFVDQNISDISCIEFLVYLKKEFPELLKVFIYDESDVQTLVDAINIGEVFRVLGRSYDKNPLLTLFDDCKKRDKRKIDVNRKIEKLISEVKTLNKIGISLTSEHNLEKLLEQIVFESRKLTNADAGSLYIVDKDQLIFIISQTESLERKQQTKDAHYKIFTLPMTKESIAGYVACTGEILNIEDVYEIPKYADYKFYSDFDKKVGYRTRSMLVVPIKDQSDNIIGVLQLINRLDSNSVVQVFEKDYENLMLSLASQAGVAIKNAQLVKEIQQLLSSIIEYSATLIDARSSFTAGHSEGVNLLTLSIANSINEKKTGVFANIFFTKNQLKELSYAAYLHDIGKIGIRETILDKSAKLDGYWIDAVENRFKYIIKSLEQDLIEEKLDNNNSFFDLKHFKNEVNEKLQEINQYIDFIKKVNLAGRLTDDEIKKLNSIAFKEYIDMDSVRKNYLAPPELENLSVRAGNLTQSERKEITSHVEKTIKILDKIPFPEYLKDVPYIAGTHHEKLDGSGYPAGLKADKLSYASRIIAVADYFEALVAFDRPYKPSKTIEEAKKIMTEEVKNNKLDADIINLLFEEELYKCLKEKTHRNSPAK
jgi:HD-GYP domain-containing protein (c-di-GMP phosphodiesterase class II)/CheY-like chemotaxis protein